MDKNKIMITIFFALLTVCIYTISKTDSIDSIKQYQISGDQLMRYACSRNTDSDGSKCKRLSAKMSWQQPSSGYTLPDFITQSAAIWKYYVPSTGYLMCSLSGKRLRQKDQCLSQSMADHHQILWWLTLWALKLIYSMLYAQVNVWR